MAEYHPYVLVKPARFLQGDVAKKSAPRGVDNAKETFYGVFGVEKEDFDALVKLQIAALTADYGPFTSPDDYQLCCVSGKKAADRELKKAQLESRGKSAEDAAKIQEYAEARAELYRQYAGIFRAATQHSLPLAQLKGGAIADIPDEEHARASAGKELFYPGAFVVPNVSLKAYPRKKADDKDGVTAYLNNMLFVRKGERLSSGGGGASNNQVFGGFASTYSEVDPLALAPDATEEALGDF
jgi:hypothetical protein